MVMQGRGGWTGARERQRAAGVLPRALPLGLGVCRRRVLLRPEGVPPPTPQDRAGHPLPEVKRRP